jgi:putative FmdB family regulatory protein
VPLYEYRCNECGHQFEKIQSFSAPPETECPVCQGPVEKLLSAPAVQFKGSGWYVTDYAGKGSGAKRSEGKSGSDNSSKDSGSSSSEPAKKSGESSSSSGSTGSSTPKSE